MITPAFIYEFFHQYILQPKYLALMGTILMLASLFKGAILTMAHFKTFKKSLLLAFISNLLALIGAGLILFLHIFISDQFVLFFSIFFGAILVLDILLITVFKGKSSWFSGFLGILLYNLLIFSGISVSILLSLLA